MSWSKTNKIINNSNNSQHQMFKTFTNLLTNISLNLNINNNPKTTSSLNINNNPKTTSRTNINKFNNLQCKLITLYDFNK